MPKSSTQPSTHKLTPPRPLCYGDILEDAYGRIVVLRRNYEHELFVVQAVDGFTRIGNYPIEAIDLPIVRLAAMKRQANGDFRREPDGTVFTQPFEVSDIQNAYDFDRR